MKDPRLERRAPRMNDRDLMKGYADELERDRQRNLSLQHDERRSHLQSDHGYGPLNNRRIPPSGPLHGEPTVQTRRSGYDSLESIRNRQQPRHYTWNPPNVPEHETQFTRPGRNYGGNFLLSDPIMDPYEGYEPYDSLQANVRPRLGGGGGFYPGYFEGEHHDQWVFREERKTPLGPPSEIEVRAVFGRPAEGFVYNDHENQRMGPTTTHFDGNPNSFDDVFF
jgi:hypothetical protein